MGRLRSRARHGHASALGGVGVRVPPPFRRQLRAVAQGAGEVPAGYRGVRAARGTVQALLRARQGDARRDSRPEAHPREDGAERRARRRGAAAREAEAVQRDSGRAGEAFQRLSQQRDRRDEGVQARADEAGGGGGSARAAEGHDRGRRRPEEWAVDGAGSRRRIHALHEALAQQAGSRGAAPRPRDASAGERGEDRQNPRAPQGAGGAARLRELRGTIARREVRAVRRCCRSPSPRARRRNLPRSRRPRGSKGRFSRGTIRSGRSASARRSTPTPRRSCRATSTCPWC